MPADLLDAEELVTLLRVHSRRLHRTLAANLQRATVVSRKCAAAQPAQRDKSSCSTARQQPPLAGQVMYLRVEHGADVCGSRPTLRIDPHVFARRAALCVRLSLVDLELRGLATKDGAAFFRGDLKHLQRD